MPRKQVTVDFSEIFHYAEKHYGLSWNECCDLYHGGEILCSVESDTKTIYLSDEEGELKYYEENPNSEYKLTEDGIKARKALIGFMKEHKLKEMLVLND